MKRMIVATLLFLVVSISSSAGPPRSVQPLQNAEGQNFCSSFSINEKQHYFATAAHCVIEAGTEDGPPKAHILGRPVEVIMIDKEADVAVVRAAFGAPAVALADTWAQAHDPIEIHGYPYGMPSMIEFRGELAYADLMVVEHDEIIHWMIFDCTAAPGNSGSPVFNKEHKVISILQVGWQAGRITGGVIQKELIRVLEPYTE